MAASTAGSFEVQIGTTPSPTPTPTASPTPTATATATATATSTATATPHRDATATHRDSLTAKTFTDPETAANTPAASYAATAPVTIRLKTKHTAQSASFNRQLVLCSAAVCSMITGTLLAFLHPEAPAKAAHPAGAGLTFAERVAYQRAIEDVYWRHRIWPRERPDRKPSLDAVMSQAQLERKSKTIC